MEARSFTVGSKLSDGPLGALHEGIHPQTQAKVLLRIVPAALNKDGRALSRMKALKRSINRLLTGQSQGDPGARPDPVLPTLLEYGNLPGGLVYLASERVVGEPLVEQRRRSMGLPLPNKALRVGRQLASCLTLAHAASLFHLRLSPSKVLTVSGGGEGEQVKLLDLGLGQALLDLLPGGLTSDVQGTEERVYLAPEQRQGELGSAAADVFALGVMLYELAAGKLPIQAAAEDAGSSQVTSLPQLLPSWQRPLSVLLERMLLTDPQARPTMGEVAAQLQHLTMQQPASTSNQPPSSSSVPPKPEPVEKPAVARPVPAATTDELSDSPTIAAAVRADSVKPPPKAASAKSDGKPDSLSDGATIPGARAVGDGLGYARTITPAQAGQPVGGDPSDTPVAVEISADYTENSAAGPGGRGEGGTAATSAEPGVGGQVALRSGQLVGNYRVNAKIGQGGMGAVYAAVHKQIGRRAAIKVLHGPLAGTADYAARFLNEARAVNMLRHPGLVEVFDFGQLPDGTLYIIMEYLEGESLRGLLRREGKLPEDEAKDLALQMGQALLAAHSKGIVHRDLKPENVMLVPDPVKPEDKRIKVLDFGIAKVATSTSLAPNPESPDFETQVGTTMGTPKYMAPEQYGGAAKVDGKADVFALGVMLYELLAGIPPFPKTSLMAFAKPPRPLREVAPTVSQKLADYIHLMLSPKPEQRPTMAEVVRELAPPPMATAQVAVVHPPKRSAVGLVLLGLLLMGAVAASVVIYEDRFRPRTAPDLVIEANDLALEVNAARARALSVLYVGLRSTEPGLRAQAVRALGQSRDAAQWTSIVSLLKDPDPLVQVEAVSALGTLGALDAQPVLLQLLDASPPLGLRVAVAGALAKLQSQRGRAVLRELMQSSDERIRLRAALLLVESGGDAVAAKPVLRDAVEKPGLPEDVQLRVLSRLAQTGDAQAVTRLREALGGDEFSLRRVSAAAGLARIGDPSGKELLRQAAQREGSTQLLAALILATVGDSLGFARMVQVATSPSYPEASRLVAADGLAACGRRQGAQLLLKVLDEPKASQQLRQAAAGAIVQIAGGDPDQIAKQSLGWAQAALGHDDWLVRESAMVVLGDIESPDAVPLLSKALTDPQQAVRKGAAAALGRKRVRSALLALRTALGDAEPEVRRAGMLSVSRVAAHLQRRGAPAHDDELVLRLRQLVDTGNTEDQLTAAGTLLQLGEQSHRDRLREGLQAPDPLIRKLVVEMLPPGDDLLKNALVDPAVTVRFAAARRLVAFKVPESLPVLHEVLAGGGVDSLIAYALLKKAGEKVSPPASFGELLGRGDVPTSLAVLDIIADLPLPEALPLLQKARLDSSAEVRRRVGEVSYDFYKASPSEPLLMLMLGLLGDPDMAVRTRVSALLSQSREVAEEPVSDMASPATDLASPSDAGAQVQQGLLRIEGEEKIRFQVDDQLSQSLGTAPTTLTLPTGKHKLRYAGGQVEIEIAASTTASFKIPTMLGDQLVLDAAEAVSRHETAAAQKLIDRARALQSRGRLSRPGFAELTYQQARIYEETGSYLEAMTEYEALGKLPERKPEHTASALGAPAKLQPYLGRLIISKEVDGQCTTVTQWVRPGEHVIDQDRPVRVRAGGQVRVQLCTSGRPEP
ncbi:MAG: HEAT repeat domain-containing protein [Myxococcales bacterium]|nr:HEAT repeat domain-containing protein [Myxococcales bacterium]